MPYSSESLPGRCGNMGKQRQMGTAMAGRAACNCLQRQIFDAARPPRRAPERDRMPITTRRQRRGRHRGDRPRSGAQEPQDDGPGDEGQADLGRPRGRCGRGARPRHRGGDAQARGVRGLRSTGLFVGVSVEEAKLSVDEEADEEVYRIRVGRVADILGANGIPVPVAVQAVKDRLLRPSCRAWGRRR